MNASAMRLAAALLACALTLGIPARATSPPPVDPQIQDAIVAAAQKELRVYGARQPVPGVYIALWMPGKAPFIKGVGYADLKTRAPFQLGDKFRVGSNTKTFVITVLLQLVDEHRLSLDDPLSKFNLGVTIPNAKNITVRELAEMRSGLFEAYSTPQIDKMTITPQTHISPQQLIAWAVQQKPMFPPGTKYHYSNTNYLLLGLIIESLTHNTIGNEIRRRLITPLGLSGTSFPLYDPSMPAPYAHGYGLDNHNNWEDVSIGTPPSLTWAAGAMISTVPDMQRWVKSYVLGTMNSAATQKARLRCLPTGPPGLSFGLGIGCSGGWYGYTGGLPGYNTGAYYLPSKGITLIAFVTAQRDKPKPGAANAIVREITRIITPQNVMYK